MVSGGRRVRQSEYQNPGLTHMAPMAPMAPVGVRVEQDANPTSRYLLSYKY